MEKTLEYSKDLIEIARKYVSDAEGGLKSRTSTFSNIISNCQRAIELSAKAVFKMTGLDFPREHQLLFEQEKKEVRREVKELLQKEFPKNFVYKEYMLRLIFLTYFWHQFRTIAEYGVEELNIPPDKLFEEEDAKLALKHAELCVRIANELY